MVVVLLVGLVISQEMKVSEKAQGSEALIDTHLLDTCTSENGVCMCVLCYFLLGSARGCKLHTS